MRNARSHDDSRITRSRALALVAALLALVLAACGDDDSGEGEGEGSSLSVGMAAIGPVNDKAFNQSHWEGVQAGVEAVGGELAEPIENLEDP